MHKRRNFAAMLVLLPLAVAPLACSSDNDDRAALDRDELNRELDLALKGDTSMASFEDTAVAPPTAEPEPAAQTPAPRPQRQTPPRTTPTPKPQPTPPVVQPTPDPTPEPRTRTVTSSVPIGTTMSVALNQTLSTETNQAGDAFTATLQQPILSADGDVLVPAGATVRGRVTQVQKSGRVGETAVLNLAFEAVTFGGNSYPLDASVVSANPERVSRASTGEQVAKGAAGAAAGAILGRVLGKNTSSTIKGAVIGAAAGTAIAMGTADVDAVLKEGSTMVIRTDGPITVTRTVTSD
jgi:hypothetical protein